MEKQHLGIGSFISYKGTTYRIRKLIDLTTLLCESSADESLVLVPIKEAQPIVNPSTQNKQEPDIVTLTDQEWETAQSRYDIIASMLDGKRDGKKVKDIIQKTGISQATLYRWIKKYEQTGKFSSLLDTRGKVLKGKKKLAPEVEKIIEEGIEKIYLTKQRTRVRKTYEYVYDHCKQLNIQLPHLNTLRRRIDQISEEVKMKRRFGSRAAKEAFEPAPDHFLDAQTPLSTVMIDHTLVDLTLVDEFHRLPIGRPWITVAIDVYSRMVSGFYITFDPPSALSVGLCIAHSILPKEKWLIELAVEGEWPCWAGLYSLFIRSTDIAHSLCVNSSR